MPSDLSRVVVVGTSCSGKTTLARRLAGILGAQHVELDALYWGREWTPRLDFPKAVSAAVQQERWVIDGNYSAVRDLIWRRCTAIVWLDYSFARVFSRALRRTARESSPASRCTAGTVRPSATRCSIVMGFSGGSCELTRSDAVSFSSFSGDRSIVIPP